MEYCLENNICYGSPNPRWRKFFQPIRSRSKNSRWRHWFGHTEQQRNLLVALVMVVVVVAVAMMMMAVVMAVRKNSLLQSQKLVSI